MSYSQLTAIPGGVVKSSRSQITILLFCLGCLSVAQAKEAIDIEPRTHYDVEVAPWPTWYGPYSNRSGVDSGLKLIRDLNKARKVWVSEAEVPPGSPYVPSKVDLESLIKDPKARPPTWSGGYCAPIIAEGHLYLCYWRPAGRKNWAWTLEDLKYQNSSRNPTEGQPSTAADDIVICIDLKTGKTVWEQVYSDKGTMAGGYKQAAHPVLCFYKGKVFATGTSGLLYAIDAQSGKPLWEAPTGIHGSVSGARKANKRIPGNRPILTGSIVAGDGVVALSQGGVEAFVADTGKKTWAGTKRIRTGDRCMPNVWLKNGAAYFLFKGTLIHSKTGKVCWEIADYDVDPQHSAISGDVMVVSGCRPEEKLLSLRCYHIRTDGYSLLWEVPDAKTENGQGIQAARRSDAVIYNGMVYKIFESRSGPGAARCFDLLSGKLLASNPNPPGGPWKNAWGYHGIAADKRLIHVAGRMRMMEVGLPEIPYLSNNENPVTIPVPEYTPHAYANGFIYMRVDDGNSCRVHCYDIRKK